jgi:prevent-host-death family protein
MTTMTATEASRNFKDVLDRVEHGETIVVTRGGRRIAMLGPIPRYSGRSLKDLLAAHSPDPDWAAEHEELRDLAVLNDSEWDA